MIYAIIEKNDIACITGLALARYLAYYIYYSIIITFSLL